MSIHAYTEDKLIEQPDRGLLAEFGWTTVSALDGLSANRAGGNALAPEGTTAASISGICRVSSCCENRYSSEIPAGKGGFSVNEWPSDIRCNTFISNKFLFE